MGSLVSPELNLGSDRSLEKWVLGADTRKSSNLQDYVARLQDEMKKIEAFERELPLCMLLVKDEIARLSKEAEKSNCNHPALEFLPLKTGQFEKTVEVTEKENRDKLNWMSSVQLWNCGDHQIHDSTSNKKGVDDSDGLQGNSKNSETPLLSLCISGSSPRSSSATSSATDAKLNPRISRKVRRCWSTELHRRFIHALQQLGGAQAATPKQIRELMQVDGLTNDEVKSHLQKYRVHVRRGSASKDPYYDSTKRTKTQSLLPLVPESSTPEDKEEDDTSEIHNQ